MKKQNKVLLAAALAVSVMGGFAVQAEEKCRRLTDRNL